MPELPVFMFVCKQQQQQIYQWTWPIEEKNLASCIYVWNISTSSLNVNSPHDITLDNPAITNPWFKMCAYSGIKKSCSV